MSNFFTECGDGVSGIEYLSELIRLTYVLYLANPVNPSVCKVSAQVLGALGAVNWSLRVFYWGIGVHVGYRR